MQLFHDGLDLIESIPAGLGYQQPLLILDHLALPGVNTLDRDYLNAGSESSLDEMACDRVTFLPVATGDQGQCVLVPDIHCLRARS